MLSCSVVVVGSGGKMGEESGSPMSRTQAEIPQLVVDMPLFQP